MRKKPNEEWQLDLRPAPHPAWAAERWQHDSDRSPAAAPAGVGDAITELRAIVSQLDTRLQAVERGLAARQRSARAKKAAPPPDPSPVATEAATAQPIDDVPAADQAIAVEPYPAEPVEPVAQPELDA